MKPIQSAGKWVSEVVCVGRIPDDPGHNKHTVMFVWLYFVTKRAIHDTSFNANNSASPKFSWSEAS